MGAAVELLRVTGVLDAIAAFAWALVIIAILRSFFNKS